METPVEKQVFFLLHPVKPYKKITLNNNLNMTECFHINFFP